MEAPKMSRMHQPVHPTISEVRSDEVDGDADRKREAGDGFREWPDLKRTVIQEQDDRDDDEDVEQRGTEVLRGHLRVRDGSRAPDHFHDRPNQGPREEEVAKNKTGLLTIVNAGDFSVSCTA
jgi:hypothetical protein